MSQAHIGFPAGIGMTFETSGRVAATAVDPYRHVPSGSEASVLAYRLEQLAERMRKQELVGPEAVERVLWTCAGFLISTQKEPVAISVTARTIADEDVPAHQVSEDEDPDEQGL
jgi:hypothetical protein